MKNNESNNLKGRMIKNLEKRNKWFNSLSKKEKRIEIIKDLKESIKSNRFITAHSYLEMTAEDTIFTENANLQEIFTDKKVEVHCHGCAIAGLLHSRVILGNEVLVNDIEYPQDNYDIEGKDIRDFLKSIFTMKQMYLIEAAYEREHDILDIAEEGEEFLDLMIDSADFGAFYNNDDDRLIAICDNILQNDGKFDPKKGLKKLKKEDGEIKKSKES